ncbi:MAG: S24 family peptidase [Usitatibacter sp.]
MMRPVIPIVATGGEGASACSGAEPFALMVLGDSMAPEFEDGDVIVVEPEGLAADGAFVLAHAAGEWIFRRLVAHAGGWRLAALDGRYPSIDIPDLGAVRGIVIQKSRPGRRRAARLYGSRGSEA